MPADIYWKCLHLYAYNLQPGNLLIHSFAHSLIRSIAHFAQIEWAAVSDLLRSLKTNEWSWANGSGHSEEMSNREQIAQVPQDKWATMSDLLAQQILAKQI